MTQTYPNDPYDNLANAIILQAVKDYREAARNENYRIMQECEQFFLSDWFTTLTGADGEVLLINLQKEAKENRLKEIQDRRRRRREPIQKP